MKKSIWEKRSEILIEYDPIQKEYYMKNDYKCIYPQWERKIGIHKAGGNFPVMVAKKYFQDAGYCVLKEFLLVRNRKKRQNCKGFKRLKEIFGEKRINDFIKKAEKFFSSKGKRACGGDPDLFVYNDERNFWPCFFVEVKENDEITQNQKILFPLIENYLCPVFIARVRPKNLLSAKMKKG